MKHRRMYQVSTLQALAMGYTRQVVTVEELLKHGDTGLGTFEGVDGEMILLDGVCYKANDDGSVEVAPPDMGIPFSAVTFLKGKHQYEIKEISEIEELKTLLDLKIEKHFGLNSMHIARVDGRFSKVRARAGSAYHSQHVSLKEILSKTQKEYSFEDIEGSLVCLYFPDYMDGINAPGWHLHFLSADKCWGGHVFDIEMVHGKIFLDKISNLEIQIPRSPAFDTYSLKNASQKEIQEVEQGK